MSRLLRNAIYSIAVAAATLPAINVAEARDRYSETYTVRRGGGADDGALAAGIIGLAAGALIVGAIASQNNQPRPVQNEYRQPRPHPDRNYFPPVPPRYEERGRWERGGRDRNYYDDGYRRQGRWERGWND